MADGPRLLLVVLTAEQARRQRIALALRRVQREIEAGVAEHGECFYSDVARSLRQAIAEHTLH